MNSQSKNKIFLEYFNEKREIDVNCYKECGRERITWKTYVYMGE
jgi:hypothetical protein